MAAFQVVDPASGDAVVLLANAQSIPYEVFSKVDMIGFGALDQMLGREPDGTLELALPDRRYLPARAPRGHAPGPPAPRPAGSRPRAGRRLMAGSDGWPRSPFMATWT